MALEIFRSQLKAKYSTLTSGVNLSQKRIDAYAARLHKKHSDLAADDVAGHDNLIDELDEIVSFKDIAKDDDRVRTLEAKAKPPVDPKSKPEEDEDEDQEEEEEQNKKKTKDRTPNWGKKLLDNFQTLNEKIGRLESEKLQLTIKGKVESHDKLKGIPKEFFDEWRYPEKDEDVDSFAERVETKWNTLKQDNNNQTVLKSSRPVNGIAPTDGKEVKKSDDKEIKDIVDKIL